MRKLRIVLAVLGGAVGLVLGFVLYWRRNPRTGAAFVNTVVNPALIRNGLVGKGRAEIGTLEHVGRRSGIRRLTPVHPEPTIDGFQIMLPLGEHSEWARNVVAAGHCRMQLHDIVYELDEPAMVPAGEMESLPWPVRRLTESLGFEYLVLRRFGSAPGSLDAADVEPTTEESRELVSTAI